MVAYWLALFTYGKICTDVRTSNAMLTACFHCHAQECLCQFNWVSFARRKSSCLDLCMPLSKYIIFFDATLFVAFDALSRSIRQYAVDSGAIPEKVANFPYMRFDPRLEAEMITITIRTSLINKVDDGVRPVHHTAVLHHRCQLCSSVAYYSAMIPSM